MVSMCMVPYLAVASDAVISYHAVTRCEEKGCMRRCGGQGDVLAGIAGLFSFWAAEKEKQ